jgi:hypothetical protein
LRKRKEYPPNYLGKLLDDVDDYIRYYHRQEEWRKRAKKFRQTQRRREKVKFD